MILLWTPLNMGSYGRKRLSHRMWFDVELRCPCRDFLEKITIDPKMGLVSLDFFSRACDFFWRLVRPNVNMEPYGKRGGGCPTFGGAATFDDAAISVNGRPAKFNDWPQVLVTLLGDLYEKKNNDLVLERVRSWSIKLLHSTSSHQVSSTDHVRSTENAATRSFQSTSCCPRRHSNVPRHVQQNTNIGQWPEIRIRRMAFSKK